MTDFTREIPPPPALEDRVVAALRNAGLIVQRGSGLTARSATIRIAAAVALIAIGYGAGTWASVVADRTEASEPRFMLFLHRGAERALSTSERASRVAEYRDWARTLRDRGIAISGDRLKPTPDGSISGFFIIQTDSPEIAREIAASCPHARYGDRVELREIDTPVSR